MKKEVAKWQNSPDLTSPLMTPNIGVSNQLGVDGTAEKRKSVDLIPLLNAEGVTGIDGGARDVARERKVGSVAT